MCTVLYRVLLPPTPTIILHHHYTSEGVPQTGNRDDFFIFEETHQKDFLQVPMPFGLQRQAL